MRVVFQCRPNLYKLSGGDKIQILKTKEYLEKEGVSVDISILNNPHLKNADIFHLFNPSLLSLKPIIECKKMNIPIIVSTIHWDMKEYYKSIFHINQEYFRIKPNGYFLYYLQNQFYAAVYNFWWYQKNLRDMKKIFEMSDVLLPNSFVEKELLKKQFQLHNKRYFIIPNGIDPLIQSSPNLFYNKYKIQNFILCAARLEYRKNQYSLIKSMMGNSIPIVLIGNNKFNIGYAGLCEKLGKIRGNTYFIDHINQEELYSAYLNAKVHVMPSWYETPGLSSLEAGYFGCNIVVSDRGSTKEYFQKFAEYCDPTDPSSIKKAVLTAYQKEKTTKLQNHIKEYYTWDKAAESTLLAYRSILRKANNAIQYITVKGAPIRRLNNVF